jgi:ribosomal protein S18 acetylase RimI-like enzyme
VASGSTLLFGGYVDGQLCGTVQLGLDTPPNQPHRGDVKKLLVHRRARGRGLASQMMIALGEEAKARGRSLLTLDTVTGSNAERLYEKLGFTKAGVIPNYALFPDGRPCATTVFWKDLG